MSEENVERDDIPILSEDFMIETAEEVGDDSTGESEELIDYLDDIAGSHLGGADEVPGDHLGGHSFGPERSGADDNPFLGDRYAELRIGSAGLSEVEDYIEEVELYR